MLIDKDKKRTYPVPADGMVDLNKMDGDRMREILVEATLGVPTVFQDYTEEVFRSLCDEDVAEAKAKGMVVDIPSEY